MRIDVHDPSSPSSLARSYRLGVPFGRQSSIWTPPSSPLGMSISRHEHYIRPVPPTYVTEYEDAYQDPRIRSGGDMIIRDNGKCRSPSRGSPSAGAGGAMQGLRSPYRPTHLLGACWRASVAVKTQISYSNTPPQPTQAAEENVL